MQQIEFDFNVPVATPTSEWWQYRTEEQQKDWLKTLASVRAEREKITRIALELFPDAQFNKLYELPSAQYGAACAEYHRRYPKAKPSSEEPCTAIGRPKRKERAYTPWTLERKHRNRINLLEKRGRKRYSLLQDLYCEWIQAELVRNPQYFGVCPLPGEFKCALNLIDLDSAKSVAVRREIGLRQ